MSAILYPIAIVAKVLNLSERRVQQLVSEGVLPKPVKGKYDLIACVQAYIKYLQERAFGNGAAPQDTHFERARLLRAQADKTELEVDTLRGNLIPIEQVESDWLTMVTSCRARLLAIPSKTALHIVALQEPEEIERFLKRSMYEALTELAAKEYDDGNPLSEDEAGSEPVLDASTGADSKPVGRSKPKTKSRSKRRTRKMDNGKSAVSKGNDGRGKRTRNK